METQVFLSVFFLIFLAELPDKTAFATFLMATRGKALAIFTGVAAAFVVQSLVAVACGGLIGLLPEIWVHVAAGALFLGFAGHILLSPDEEPGEEQKPIPKRAGFWKAAGKAFVVIFVAEWGDLTQIATASLAARYHGHPVIVLVASTSALWLVTAIAVVAGQKIGHKVNTRVLKLVSGFAMIVAGLYFIVESIG